MTIDYNWLIVQEKGRWAIYKLLEGGPRLIGSYSTLSKAQETTIKLN